MNHHIARPATRRLALQALEIQLYKATRNRVPSETGYRYCPADSLEEAQRIERRIKHIQSIGK